MRSKLQISEILLFIKLSFASFCPLSTNHCTLKKQQPTAFRLAVVFIPAGDPKTPTTASDLCSLGSQAVETVARIFLDAINHCHVRPPGRV